MDTGTGLTPGIILIIIGSVFLLVALLGGEIQIKDWLVIPKLKPWWGRVISGVVGVFMIAAGFLTILKQPQFSLQCPGKIVGHEAFVYGTAPQGSRITLYVHPQDGSSNYWLQGGGGIEVGQQGLWGHLARFGNPFGIGHRRPPPLDYEVYAIALLGKGQPPTATELSGTQDVLSLLRDRYQLAEKCIIRRDPELVLPCRSEELKILYPLPIQCPFAAEQLVDPDCDPTKISELSSPVTFRWEPEISMFVELYHDGRPVLGLNGETRLEPNAPEVDEVRLRPGEYEFKIAKIKDADCKASVWFRVVSEAQSKGGEEQ